MAFSKRPWWRLHWVTLALLLIPASAAVQCVFPDREGLSKRWVRVPHLSYGWPVVFFEEVVTKGPTEGSVARRRSRTTVRKWSLDGLVVNLLVWTTLFGGTGFVVERQLRRAGGWRQTRLIDVLALISVVAVMLAWRQWELQVRSDHAGWDPAVWAAFRNASWTLFEPGWAAWSVRAPLFFAVGCAVYTLGWLAARGVAVCIKSLTAALRKGEHPT